MKKEVYFHDTNSLLTNEELESIKEKFYVSSTTLLELENIKTNKNKDEDVRYRARRVTRWLKDNEDLYEVVFSSKTIYDLVESFGLEIDNDNLIVGCAYQLQKESGYKVNFITNDMCCYNIAKHIFGLNCSVSKRNLNENYKGYLEIDLDTNRILDLYDKYGKGENFLELIENQYLIINNGEKTIELRYTNGGFEPLSLPPSNVIKGLNAKQRLALDLLNNKNIPIKVIAGTYGSGKTLLSIRSALYQLLDKGTISKLMLVRNPIGSGQDVGFLPGTLEDKTKDFFLPIVQNLEGGQFQLEDLKMKGMVEAQIPYFMKGMSLEQTFILVDEAEDMDSKIFKLIGSRVGKDSYVVFCGDWKQAESKYVHNNGLSKFINYIKKNNGNPLVGVVVMDDDVRSDASKVFAEFE